MINDEMRKTSTLLFFWIIFVLLSSCKEQEKKHVVLPINTPKPTAITIPTQIEVQPPKTLAPTQTRTLTPTATPTPTQTPVLTPSVTLIPPYPTKQVILDYDVMGSHSVFDLFYTDFGWSELVIYADGQMIIPRWPPEQKILSTDEVNQVLLHLENKKFFELESNQAHDPTDQLYDMGDQYSRVYDARLFCVYVNGEKTRKLCAYEPFIEFLVPEMKEVLTFLDNYRPAGMEPYYPDRILLWVQLGRNSNITNLSEETVPWSDNFPSLAVTDQEIIYVEGDTAKEIFALFADELPFKVFSQAGQEYTVLLDVVLPHEEIINR